MKPQTTDPLWSLEVGSQGVARALLSLKVLGEDPSSPPPASGVRWLFWHFSAWSLEPSSHPQAQVFHELDVQAVITKEGTAC